MILVKDDVLALRQTGSWLDVIHPWVQQPLAQSSFAQRCGSTMVECLNHVVGERSHLERFDHFPVALLDVPASGIRCHLAGPSLFHLPGRAAAPLFVSVLLHGNEDTGWQAVQTVLQRHRGNMLPRPLLLFVGTVEAAKANVRTLPTQTDYNRIWPGTLLTSTPEAELMREVTDIVKGHRPFASIDIHNNTGRNPHYACVNRLEERFFHLARLFSRTVVYFKKPLGVQSAALAPIWIPVLLVMGVISLFKRTNAPATPPVITA